MLESLVQKYAPRRIISALLVAATISLSSSSYAKQPPIILAQASPPSYLHQDPDAQSSLNLACSDYIDGRAKIGTTDYCVTKDARIYHRNGKELDDLHLNPDFVRLLMQTSDFKQALRQAQTGSAPAVVPTAPPPASPVTPPVEKKPAPPPYLLSGGGTSSPEYLPSSMMPSANEIPSPERSPTSSAKSGSDYAWGAINLIGGGLLVLLGAQPVTFCSNNNCKSGIPPWGYPLMIGGGLLALDGIYLLAR